ncbi:hypothetical protein QFZ81_004001 [Paenibacillus sp. V4I9]|uniref:dsDNA nuclease domain-containing protein n=1 Tax=Paenibacillus sp. V4I9 TaxID=3042308 RepID=UPI00277F6EC2|nr:dsDNA nuclease domain-containing protein [Paenibacillus sp. V4I9]MDQ0888913.1 hypothetical protein [Paenibacillus sp. V4I9]
MEKHKIEEILLNKEHETLPEEQELLKTFLNANKVEAIEKLYTIDPKDVGGRTALAGFYFQFLVTIEYILEMLDGKWDYVACELHEDIIVGKEKHIKFIQVKTSEKTELSVSGTITRTKKEIEGVKRLVSDSWIDKLLVNSKHFKSKDGYLTEFELVTTFVLTKTNEIDVSNYDRFIKKSEIIKDDDSLLVYLSKDVYLKKEKVPFFYEEECGENLKELLSRFLIRKEIDLLNFRKYELALMQSLGDKIHRRARVNEDDFYMLIGELMQRCAKKGDNTVLFITKDEAKDLLGKIEDRVVPETLRYTAKYNAESIFDEIFGKIRNEISLNQIYLEIEHFLENYKVYLLEWTDGTSTVRELVNRLVDGWKDSDAIYSLSQSDIVTKLTNLIKINLILMIIYDATTNFSSNYSKLLVKEINNEVFFSFLSLSMPATLDQALEKLKKILARKYRDGASLEFLIHTPKTILLGDFLDNDEPLRKLFIKDIKPYIGELDETARLDEVVVAIDVIPGEPVMKLYRNLFGYNDLKELREKLTEKFIAKLGSQ